MDGGQVAVLLVHDANPVYALPKASGFADKLKKVPFKVSTALFLDETAAQCDLLLPQHHALERWDDLAPRAGVRSLMQPVMEPVFDTRAAGDILLLAAKKAGGALAKFTDASWEARLREPLAGPRGRAEGSQRRRVLARGAAARRRVRRGRGAAAAVALAPIGHGDRATPRRRSRGTASSSF